jgi:hypothetical protein
MCATSHGVSLVLAQKSRRNMLNALLKWLIFSGSLTSEQYNAILRRRLT